MVDDAENAAAEDQEKFEKIETRNKLDSLIYQSEKLLNTNEDKLSSIAKDSIISAIENAKTSLDNDTSLSDALDNLQQVLHNISEELYSQNSQQDNNGNTGADDMQDDIVDAEFEEA